MELPVFDGQGTGPQGTGGIPPEEFMNGLRGEGVDLVNQTIRPEDSAAAQAVLAREVDALLPDQGGIPSDAQPAAPARPATPQPQAAAPASAGQPQPVNQPGHATDPDLAERVRQARARYGNDMDRLAEGYVSLTRELSRARQEGTANASTLEREVRSLTQQLASMMATPRQDAGAFEEAGQPGAAAAAVPTAEEFFQNPVVHIQRVVQETVQQNLLAVEEARRRREQEAGLRDMQSKNAADIKRLSPIINDLYNRQRHIYDRLPAAEAAQLLLEQARDKEAVAQGVAFYRTTLGLDEPGAEPGAGQPTADANGVPVSGIQPAPAAGPMGSLPTGGIGGRRAVGAAPTGNWSNTEAMKRLMRSPSDSVAEMDAITKVLGERGFYE